MTPPRAALDAAGRVPFWSLVASYASQGSGVLCKDAAALRVTSASEWAVDVRAQLTGGGRFLHTVRAGTSSPPLARYRAASPAAGRVRSPAAAGSPAPAVDVRRVCGTAGVCS